MKMVRHMEQFMEIRTIPLHSIIDMKLIFLKRFMFSQADLH